MKTTTLKRTSIMILLALASIFICALFVSQNSYAFADESNETSWDYKAELDRIGSTFAEDGEGTANEETEGNSSNVFYVVNHFNIIKRNVEDKEFSFTYNLRGYIGEPHGTERTPNVQYFYNTQTKEMVFLTFGKGEVGFATYTYHGTFDTIFEDEISYKIDNDNWFKYDIAENAETCYLDPKIQELGQYTFQCWEKLQFVDIINKEYSHVQMNICDCAFRKVNMTNGCEVKFFNVFDNNKRTELLTNTKRWAEDATIIYDGKMYCSGNWEEVAEQDRISSTKAADKISAPKPEVEGGCLFTDRDTYHVLEGFNCVTRNINGTEFSFVYDLRGFIGDQNNQWGRKPNVQYFYNTQTKEMVFLTFGVDEVGFRTFKNNTTSNTVFEDYNTYGENFKYKISDKLEKCYLDPKITGLGQYVFQCCINLKEVDIINQKYENVNMEIGDCAFRKVNMTNGCEVKFFNAFDNNERTELLTNTKRWAEDTTIIYDGKMYCSDWKRIAEVDRLNSTFAEDGEGTANEETEGTFSSNVFYVVSHFNIIKRNVEDKEFSFTYNLRGYIGEPHGTERTPNVQYFYNTQTKEMVFLTFGKGEVGFATYTYHGTFNTIFEDEISYKIDNDNRFWYDIAENAETCYLDPKIQELGQYTFQCWEKLQFVDIINKEYSHVNMNIRDCAFRKANRDNGCEMRFLNAFDTATQNRLLTDSERARWAGYCPVIFNGHKYDPVD